LRIEQGVVRLEDMTMIVVGGVPGAGKSTAVMRHLGERGVRVLDPDLLRGRVPHRWMVHTLHQVLVWGSVLLGPGLMGTLLIQDTATRRGRREALLRLGRRRGWRVHLVLVDVSRADALAGQVQRGRVVAAKSFERHWQRWTWMRADLERACVVPPTVVTRRDVADVVDALVGTGAGAPSVAVRG
jgi:predicted kinase